MRNCLCAETCQLKNCLPLYRCCGGPQTGQAAAAGCSGEPTLFICKGADVTLAEIHPLPTGLNSGSRVLNRLYDIAPECAECTTAPCDMGTPEPPPATTCSWLQCLLVILAGSSFSAAVMLIRSIMKRPLSVVDSISYGLSSTRGTHFAFSSKTQSCLSALASLCWIASN